MLKIRLRDTKQDKMVHNQEKNRRNNKTSSLCWYKVLVFDIGISGESGAYESVKIV